MTSVSNDGQIKGYQLEDKESVLRWSVNLGLTGDEQVYLVKS